MGGGGETGGDGGRGGTGGGRENGASRGTELTTGAEFGAWLDVLLGVRTRPKTSPIVKHVRSAHITASLKALRCLFLAICLWSSAAKVINTKKALHFKVLR